MFKTSHSCKKSIQVGQRNIETFSFHEDYSFYLSPSILPIEELWDTHTDPNNLFLQSAYLKTLEQFPPEKMRFYYLVFYKKDSPIGVAYFQSFHLKVEDSIQKKEEETHSCVIRVMINAFKNWLIKKAEFNVLICGNLLLTGEHGFYIHPSVSTTEATMLAEKSGNILHQLLENNGSKMHISLFKDYCNDYVDHVEPSLVSAGYNKFTIQPSMCIPLPESWKTFDDYLESMSSKYRVRARRAAKKGKDIKRQELTYEEILANKDRIFELYKSIADNAGFNAFVLHKDYFAKLKYNLGDRYKLVAYYIENELVAFHTILLNGVEMEAHFLGVDEKYNRDYQVYLNILYDLVRAGIYHQVKIIDFARTALEIKSSVGAIPREMHCFLKHRNSLSSSLIKMLFSYLSPEEKWKPRHPFKDEKLLPAPLMVTAPIV